MESEWGCRFGRDGGQRGGYMTQRDNRAGKKEQPVLNLAGNSSAGLGGKSGRAGAPIIPISRFQYFPVH